MTTWHTNTEHGLDIFNPGGVITQGIEIDARPHPAADLPPMIDQTQAWARMAPSVEHVTMPIAWPATPQAWQILAAARGSERGERHEQRINRAARILCFLAAIADLAFGFGILGQGPDTPALTTVLAGVALMTGGGVFVALIFVLTE